MTSSRPENVPSPAGADQTSSVGDFWALLKPKVMSLVVFSGFAGYWLAPGREALHPVLATIGIFALALGAGAAGAFNMWYDRDIDAVMKRTQGRPLPLGRILPDDALGFAIFATVFAVMLMGLTTNWAAAALLLFATVFYVVIYTMWLKRRTSQNIVIGGAAGAFPPMIGWAMVTGDVSLASLILFLIIFLWTPPHFWALALFANEDYKRAGVPMLPVVAGPQATKRQMLLYTILLFPVAILPSFIGLTGLAYGIGAAIAGGLFIYAAVMVMREQAGFAAARRMFGYSVLYLFALFLGMMLDKT
ncbi:MAG: heme o synthase [Pseudomonadota bacterium]